ncbi:hypothetical protein F1D05_19470 [Kribbella qitaiheensis]|uniref:Restriction endonuclease type IV Mrr domain-containing protein n=1 Tax=Kribbella qitaiheensis TaxID=1544730 RepID=A0A7G6X0D8_9ACTN|nr:hypothetical protein [Kribbella qitaiheensis]QNE19703.1 hypothetical protein F1D05_19470 [Kribbella qitaiheensis]
MEIEWAKIGRDKFDRIVEALFTRLYDGADEFRVYDGRGGDGGKDIYVRQGGRVRIIQLKYFPEGFSKINVKRRDQIKRSFASALEDAPYEWILVVPCNLTQSEQKYVDGLKGDSKIRVDYVDQARLNERLSAHLDIVAYFTRDDSITKALIYNREKDLLTGGVADVEARIRALHSVIDDADLNWGLDFSSRNGEVTQVIRAKHSRAAEVSPVGINMTTTFGPDQKSLESIFRRQVDYGITERVTLPPDVVASFEVTGPELLAWRGEGVEVTLYPAESPRLPFVFEFQDANSGTLSSHTGVTRSAAEATRGRSLVVCFYDAITLTLLFPHDASVGGEIKMSLDFQGADPFTVLRMLQLIDALENSVVAAMKVDGNSLGKIMLNSQRSLIPASSRADFERLRLFADDLNIVQRHCESYFPMPEDVSGEDRLYLRCARLLIEGKCAVVPRMNNLTVHLNGADSDGLRTVLESEAGVFMMENEIFGFEMFGHSFMLGPARTFSLRTKLTNAADAVRALEAGEADGFKLQVVPDGTESFWTYLPERWNGSGDEWPRPVGWGLEDFNDPADTLLP